jgi:hypothetical protein
MWALTVKNLSMFLGVSRPLNQFTTLQWLYNHSQSKDTSPSHKLHFSFNPFMSPHGVCQGIQTAGLSVPFPKVSSFMPFVSNNIHFGYLPKVGVHLQASFLNSNIQRFGNKKIKQGYSVIQLSKETLFQRTAASLSYLARTQWGHPTHHHSLPFAHLKCDNMWQHIHPYSTYFQPVSESDSHWNILLDHHGPSWTHGHIVDISWTSEFEASNLTPRCFDAVEPCRILDTTESPVEDANWMKHMKHI